MQIAQKYFFEIMPKYYLQINICCVIMHMFNIRVAPNIELLLMSKTFVFALYFTN